MQKSHAAQLAIVFEKATLTGNKVTDSKKKKKDDELTENDPCIDNA